MMMKMMMKKSHILDYTKFLHLVGATLSSFPALRGGEGGMVTTAREAIDRQVELLRSMKPHEVPSHAVAHGQWNGQESALQTVMLIGKVEDFKNQMFQFGILLKRRAIEVKTVVLIVQGMMPDMKMRPVSLILAMTKSGEYKQSVLDYKDDLVISSSNITEHDREICAAVFLGQAYYKPEINEAARWN